MRVALDDDGDGKSIYECCSLLMYQLETQDHFNNGQFWTKNSSDYSATEQNLHSAGCSSIKHKICTISDLFSLSNCIMRCLEDVELKSALFSCTQYKHKDHELYKQCLQLHSGDPKRKKEKTPITAWGRRDGNPWQEFKELWEGHMIWTPERKKTIFYCKMQFPCSSIINWFSLKKIKIHLSFQTWIQNP